MAKKKLTYYLYKTHAMLGLILGLFFLMMGLSGSVLVFSEEIEHLYAPDLPLKKDTPVSLDAAVRNVTTHYPDWEIRIRNVNAKGQPLELDLRRPDDRRLLFVHPETGDILKAYSANDMVHNWLLKLHYSLHAGVPGRIIIFVIGILFMISIITGIIIFRKSILKVLSFKQRINFKSKRGFYSSAHRITGTWGIITSIILVITGLFISYSVVMNGLKTSGNPVQPVTPMISISLDQSIDKLQTRYDGFNISYMRLPTQPETPVRFYGKMKSDFLLYSEYSNYIMLDANTGEVETAHFVQDQGAYAKWDAMLIPLHFGNFGGLIIKIIYCIAGLIPAALSISGFLIWYQRTRKPAKKSTPAKISKTIIYRIKAVAGIL